MQNNPDAQQCTTYSYLHYVRSFLSHSADPADSNEARIDVMTLVLDPFLSPQRSTCSLYV